jgi:hypothetical protein
MSKGQSFSIVAALLVGTLALGLLVAFQRDLQAADELELLAN